MTSRCVVPLAVVVALIGTPFLHADDDGALAFNEAIVATNKKLEAAGFEFGKVLGPALSLEVVDSRKLKEKHDILKKTFAESIKELKLVKVPDSDEARAFKKSHDRFLEGQKEMIEIDLKLIQKVVDDASLDAAAKKIKIETILESAGERENKAHQVLTEAQLVFAKRHNLKIVEDDE